MEIIAFMLISFYILISYSQVSGAEDTVTQSHPLTDGNTLISKNGSFEMGFFSPANSSSRYLGIWVWQKNIPVKHVIWVANKEKPIEDLSGLLMINSTGNVVLLSQNNTVVWSKTPIREVQNPVLQLLDSGNLVLREEETEENSEKYLCQSLDFSSIRRLIAEKTQNGLSPGNLARRADIANFCDSPRVCGPNGGCDVVKAPNCYCLKGFQPKSPNNWKNYDNTDGCVRTETLNCSTDGFVKYVSLKLPNSTYSFSNQTNNLKECEQKCMSNCSCMAYASSDINGSGTGCAMWYDDLIDVKLLVDGGKDLYIRMAASELVTHDGHMVKTGLIIGSAVALISGMILAFYYIRRKKRNSKGHINEEQEEDLELPLYGLSKIARATGNFSINNKLGEGGFGPVYMGTLDGRDIAVKRLSKSSGQGIKEFKNEVILISKLQHRNLVKLLGCSIQDKEKLLIYEYMPNKSLDSFIFDQTRRKLLDWSKRFHIICGIARGLLYLHQDSRLRIIHRDLKASNVLLDSEMNPKISDFGLARICGEDQTAGNTNRVVGTYGYMAPEYAIDGRFSVKSDVFSFGILLLEIVTGKKNRGFYCPNESVNLVGHAWNLWKEGRPLELVDNCMGESCDLSEVLRCIHISILCMQQHPQDRPNMSSVIMMLESKIALPPPKQPGFLIVHNHDGDSSSSKNASASVNDLSITVLDAR